MNDSSAVVIIWCDSKQGKISFRADEDTNPIVFDYEQIKGLNIPLYHTSEEVFGILRNRDGQKVAVPHHELGSILGWA